MGMRWIFGWCLLLVGLQAESANQPPVDLIPMPDRGVQPQVQVAPSGVIHLVYHKGEPGEGDLFYVRMKPDLGEWSTPIQVNQLPHSVVATGTVRGHQLAVAHDGTVHVIWFGNKHWQEPKSEPSYAASPLMIATLPAGQEAFNPEKNLLSWTQYLDGGGSLAVDRRGAVFVAWHGRGDSKLEGEQGREIFMSVSIDGGKTFSREQAVSKTPQGVCSCCGMRIYVDPQDGVHMLYRGLEGTTRPMVHLHSTDRGKTFAYRLFDSWDIQACPMSLVSMAHDANGVAWIANEWESSIRLHRQLPNQAWVSQTPQDGAWKGKHPWIAMGADGQVLLSWADGAGWGKGGQLRWALINAEGQTVFQNEAASSIELPVWSFASAVHVHGRFKLFY